jgi:hypothetical protein
VRDELDNGAYGSFVPDGEQVNNIIFPAVYVHNMEKTAACKGLAGTDISA